jgi:hypothetical protein
MRTLPTNMLSWILEHTGRNMASFSSLVSVDTSDVSLVLGRRSSSARLGASPNDKRLGTFFGCASSGFMPVSVGIAGLPLPLAPPSFNGLTLLMLLLLLLFRDVRDDFLELVVSDDDESTHTYWRFVRIH